MIQLMSQCQLIDTQYKSAKTEVDGVEAKSSTEPATVANTLPILRGIIPGLEKLYFHWFKNKLIFVNPLKN